MERPNQWSVRKGQSLRVAFGSKGSQYAVCIGHNRNGYPMIVTWRNRGREWTKPKRLCDSSIIGAASLSDWTKQGSPVVPLDVMATYKD